MLKHTGTIEIESERLILRQFTYNDIPHMLKNWVANPNVQTEYGEPIYTTFEEVYDLLSQWINNYNHDDFYRWSIVLKENKENIGQIAFCKVYTDLETAEIEYCISENYAGNGYATEALTAVMTFSFSNPKFSKLEAYHRIANPRSGSVLKKTLMKQVATIRRFELENINPKDEICYAMTRWEHNSLKV